MGIELKIYNSFEELAGFQAEWDCFVENNGADIFMTYDWCRVWWEHYGKGRHLHICIFKNEEKELVGILPVFSEVLWVVIIPVKVVKIVGSDFTLSQFSLPILANVFGDVIKAVVDWCEKCKFDVLLLGELSGRYSDLINFSHILPKKLNNHVRIDCDKPQTYFSIPATFDAYLSGLSKNERGDIKRNYRNISKKAAGGDEVKYKLADAESLNSYFNEFYESHQRQWHDINKLGHFGDWPDSKEFHYELCQAALEKGWLRLFKIVINDFCLGYEYDYSFGKRYYEILNTKSDAPEYDKISLGKINFCEQVKHAIEEQAESIDSMRGHYPHKIKLGGIEKQITKIFITKSFCSRLKFKLLVKYSQFINLLYYKIWFCRLASKLLSYEKRKPLWELWSKMKIFS